MKTYKGFDKDMKCRGFQYEEGGEYEHKGKVKACDSGFHACEDPIDCFSYYPPASSVYHVVEQEGDISKDNDDSKIASSKIKIGARIDVLGIAKAHMEYVKERVTSEHTDPKLATAGYSGAATAGYRGAATAGSYGAATAGDSGAATAGDRGAATSRGSSSVGENGIACARGNGCRIKGGIGAVLVIAEENDDDCDIKEWTSVVVDGNKIKADTWYKLVDGKLVEDANDD